MKKFPDGRILSDYAPKTSGFAFGGNVSGGGSAAQTDRPIFNFGTTGAMIDSLNNNPDLHPIQNTMEDGSTYTDYYDDAGKVKAHVSPNLNVITMYNEQSFTTYTNDDRDEAGTIDRRVTVDYNTNTETTEYKDGTQTQTQRETPKPIYKDGLYYYN